MRRVLVFWVDADGDLHVNQFGDVGAAKIFLATSCGGAQGYILAFDGDYDLMDLT